MESFPSEENNESSISDFSPKRLDSSVLKNFFQKFFSPIFHTNEDMQINPKNRIQKIIPKLNIVLTDLKNIENKVDEQDSALIAFIIEPLIKQGEGLKSQIISSSSNSLKPQLISQYVQWIDRAFKWINIVEFQNKPQLLHFISKYISNETLTMIKKDILLIMEYQEQKLEKLDISEEESIRVKDKIHRLLEPIFNKFNDLQQNLSEFVTIEELTLWKQEVNAARQLFFDQCLSIIDDITSIEFPLRKYKDGNDHLVNILSQIIDLEKDMAKLIDEQNHLDESKAAKYYILNKANLLHKEARELSLDIRLSQEFFERVQIIISQIDVIYASLNK